MNNYRDIEEINKFIEGMTHSVKEGAQEMIDEGKSILNVIMYLIKRPNENGGTDYGMGGGPVPNDEIGKIIHNKIVPMIIQKEGNTILCSCEATYFEGKMKVKFHNYVTDEENCEVFDLNKPYQVSDLMSNICLN